MIPAASALAPARHPAAAFGGGALIGTLGGLIGLGGAEFRLPLLLGPFRFPPLQAVILNKAMSLIVVATALPFRARVVPLDQVGAHWPVIVNLLAGSLVGAWFGAGWATRLRSETLYRVIAGLLVVIAAFLLLGHEAQGGEPILTGVAQAVAGVVAGFLIGVVASVMGVAGGELLIPTLVLLFEANIKLAGSLSLAVSLPTMTARTAALPSSVATAASCSSWRRARSWARSWAACSLVWCRARPCCPRSRRSSLCQPGRSGGTVPTSLDRHG